MAARPQPVATRATPEDRVLDLQKAAGNRATGAALARWGMASFPLGAMPRWPKEPEAVFDGDLVVPLTSYSTSASRAGSSGASGSAEPRESAGGTMEITTRVGDHTPRLVRAAASGEHFATLELVVPGPGGGIRFTLTDVMLTSYHVSGDLETYSLHFAKREFSTSPPTPRR